MAEPTFSPPQALPSEWLFLPAEGSFEITHLNRRIEWQADHRDPKSLQGSIMTV
jgi:Mg2+/Co2+ transporter CorB